MSTKRAQVWFLLFATFVGVRSECDLCQRGNSVACHSATAFSLCIDGAPTNDYITCPEDNVCTPDAYVCYPKDEAAPSCARNEIVPIDTSNKCGVCNTPNRVFACIDAITIAFCFGSNVPNLEAIAYCPEGTVCDLMNTKEFCTAQTQVLPSCKREPSSTTTAATTFETTTAVKDITTTTTSSEQPATTTTSASATPPTTTTTPTPTSETTASTTSEEPTTTTTETTPPTTTTTATTTTEPTTTTLTTTTTEPTTTTEATTTTTEATTTSIEATTTTTTEATTISTTTTTEGTTATTTEGTTTTATPRTPDALCKEMGSSGSYKPDGDTTCKKFVVCYKIGETWFGLNRDCPTGQYFDPPTSICQPSKPAGCP